MKFSVDANYVILKLQFFNFVEVFQLKDRFIGCLTATANRFRNTFINYYTPAAHYHYSTVIWTVSCMWLVGVEKVSRQRRFLIPNNEEIFDYDYNLFLLWIVLGTAIKYFYLRIIFFTFKLQVTFWEVRTEKQNTAKLLFRERVTK